MPTDRFEWLELLAVLLSTYWLHAALLLGRPT